MRKIALLLFLFTLGLRAYAAQSQSDDVRGCSNASELKNINVILTRIDQDLECILLQLEDFDCGTAIETIVEQTAEIASKIALLAQSPDCCDQVTALLSLVSAIDSKIDFAAESSCCEQISQIFSTIMSIETKLTNLVAGDCCSLVEAIVSRIPSIESKVTSLDITAPPCTKIPVTGQTTISSSGYYCLANNIEGTRSAGGLITILTNDVILDLNGYTITLNPAAARAILSIDRIASPSAIHINVANNVIIRNGIITCGTFRIDNIGIDSHDSENLRIEDILINGSYNFGFGIILAGIIGGVIDNVHVSSCATDGLLIEESSSNLVRNCTFNNNGKHGLHITDSSNNTIQNCTANFNIFSEITNPSFIDMVGFLIENEGSDLLSFDNKFIGCSAGGHTESITDSAAAGFRIGNIGNAFISPSNAGSGNMILSCVAQGNNIGIDIILSDGTQLVKDSAVINNNAAGFRHSPNLASSSTSLIEYLNNAAIGNLINYDDPSDPAYNGPIVPYESLTPNLDLYWGNVQLQ